MKPTGVMVQMRRVNGMVRGVNVKQRGVNGVNGQASPPRAGPVNANKGWSVVCAESEAGASHS